MVITPRARARVRLRHELGLDGLLDDQESVVVEDDAFDLADLVAAHDHESLRIPAHGLVLTGRRRQRFRATRIAALADELNKADRGPPDLVDALVHLTGQRLVAGESFGRKVHDRLPCSIVWSTAGYEDLKSAAGLNQRATEKKRQ
jgi:hypothetical protein